MPSAPTAKAIKPVDETKTILGDNPVDGDSLVDIYIYINLTYSRWTSSLPSYLCSVRIFPSLLGSRLTSFNRQASTASLQLVTQWLKFWTNLSLPTELSSSVATLTTSSFLAPYSCPPRAWLTASSSALPGGPTRDNNSTGRRHGKK